MQTYILHHSQQAYLLMINIQQCACNAFEQIKANILSVTNEEIFN